MDKEKQKNIDNLKSFPINLLLKKNFYIDILIDDNWHQGFIKEEKPNDKYDIIYSSKPSKTLLKQNISRKGLSFFGDNYYQNNNNIREILLDRNFIDLEIDQLNDMILKKLTEININYDIIENIVSKYENNADKENQMKFNEKDFDKDNPSLVIEDNNNKFNITGFYSYQFFSGFLIDTIVYINSNLEEIRASSVKDRTNLILDKDFEKLLKCVLNIIIFILILGKNNLSKIKDYIQFNRKKILINKIYSILASIVTIVSNTLIIFCYEYFNHPDIEKKLKIICTLCYEIIINSTKNNKNNIPIQSLAFLIDFIIYEDNIIRIENFDKNKVYKIFLSTIENITGDDIKLIKDFSKIYNYCSNIIKKLYKSEKSVLINKCYYTFLINCLKKTNILEKKIMALNCINDIIINLLEKEDELNMIFYNFFVEQKKIMNIFFEETVHDEILKRSIELFKYLSIYDMLKDDLLNKLINLNNNTVKNILCEIVKKTKNKDKKLNLFNKITKDFNFDKNDNRNNIIDFVSKLTLACFYSIDNLNVNENELTDGNIENDSIFNNMNNEINKKGRRISVNVQLLKKGGLIKNNSHKTIPKNNLDMNESYDKLLKHSSTRNIIKRKDSNFKKTNKKNYYGLELLFNYIIFNYNETKAITNNENISKAIKSFKYILDSSNVIQAKDINYFMDKLFENINNNKKHNSIVQSLILMEILLKKLLNKNNNNNNIYNNIQNFENDNISNFDISDEASEIIVKADNNYEIITLITNDLIRYVSVVNESIKKDNKIKDNYKNKVFEGIYPYMINISTRLKILFLFVNIGLSITEEEHISKIYSLFKTEQFKKERCLFFKEITNSISSLDAQTIQNIFTKIFQNNSQFDISSFNEDEALDLIFQLFEVINLSKDYLINDTKTIRVNKDINKLEGFNFLLDILISNKSHSIQNKLCKILTHYCLYISNYKKDFSTKYWNNYINKITDLMVQCHNNKNINGIFFLIQLIESIYSTCNNFSWKIPSKEETHVAQEPFKLFHFCCDQRSKKEYKLKVGSKDLIFHMRWKLAYFYDIHINDLVLSDIDKKEYDFTNDDLKFYDIFPPKKYLINDSKYICINVHDYKGQLLKIDNNPKELIEKNEKIINILINNLNNNINSEDGNKNDNILMKKRIWNIMQKLPKKKYLEKIIIKYNNENEEIDNDEIIKMFNINEIFILTFNLQCILQYLYDAQYKAQRIDPSKLTEINGFLENFINNHHADIILYKNFLNINLKNNLNDDIKFIYFECIKALLELIQILEEYKKKKNISIILDTNNNKDKETIQTKEDNANDENKENDLENTKIHNISEIKDSILEKVGNIQLFDKLTDIIIIILNDNNSSNDLICFNLLEELIKFIEKLKTNNHVNNNNNLPKNYFEYIFEKEEAFKKIFIYDFIKCTKEEVKKQLSNFLLKNLFDNYLSVKVRNKKKEENEVNNQNNNKKKFIKNYYDIILTPKMFEYLVNNENKDSDSYFNLLSKIIDKYRTNIKKANGDQKLFDLDNPEENKKFTENFKKIIDLIIKILSDKNSIIYKNKNDNKQSLICYPYKNPSSLSPRSNNSSTDIKKKNKKKEDSIANGILLFLLRILELSSDFTNSIIEYFLNKVDVCDLFILKGILYKCNENCLKENDCPYNSTESHEIIFKIILFLLKYLDNNQSNMKENKYINNCLYIRIWETLNKFHKLGFWKENKNWEINNNDSNRKEFIGLKNMAATCYMNSILQQIFMIPMLRETILSIGNDNKIKIEQNTVLYQLQLLFASLKSYDFKYYDPKNFVLASKLPFTEQMDADEYYGQLIDKLENEISDLFDQDADKNKYKDLFKYFFAIKLTDELFFIDCNHKRFNESFCYNIQLEVKNYSNVNDSLKNYFKTEIMSGDNKINCEECNTKRVCHKKLRIKTLPNILVISLKRFDYDYKSMTKFKLNNYFEFPFELDISDYLINNKNNDIENNENKNDLYELTGITIHDGVSDYGHYYDLIKAENNKWYKFNDTNISEFNESEIPKEAFGERENEIELDAEKSNKFENLNIKEQDKKNAYILIYTKKNFKNNVIKNNEYKTILISPPYDKYSNINNEMKSYINLKMFKFWTLDSLSNPYYQSFIIDLLKIDLIKNINQEINKTHKELIEDLRNGDYLPIQNYINTGNIIFSFGLLYFCNIMLRTPKEKNLINIYKEILLVYLENDINKCFYVLEEFSNDDTIDEFLYSCQNFEAVKIISELITFSFHNYLLISENENNSDNNLNLFKFLNSIILFISNKVNAIGSNMYSLDNLCKLLFNLVNKKNIFLKYLKNKGIHKWLEELINKTDNAKNEISSIDNDYEQVNMNFILTQDNFPKLECDHHILSEKTNEFDFGINFMKTFYIETERNKISKKAKNNSITSKDSINLLKQLQDDIKETNL